VPASATITVTSGEALGERALLERVGMGQRQRQREQRGPDRHRQQRRRHRPVGGEAGERGGGHQGGAGD